MNKSDHIEKPGRKFNTISFGSHSNKKDIPISLTVISDAYNNYKNMIRDLTVTIRDQGCIYGKKIC